MAEVIYMRCSTRPQAKGDSLQRQLDVCVDHARKAGLVVGWVFCDIASGSGRLPQRAAAIEMAIRNQCSVLVESIDRWSRAGMDGSEAWRFIDEGRLIVCSAHEREFMHRTEDKLREWMSMNGLEICRKEATDGQ